MTTKGWAVGAVGAWAADAEKEEEEEKEKKKEEPYRPGAYSVSAKQEEAAFPSLGEAQKKNPKKKGKGQTLSLSEFTTGQSVGLGTRRTAAGSETGRLTVEEMMVLPRGPRERDESEAGGLGGGFKGYGGQRGPDRESQRGDRGDRGDREDGFGRDRDEGPSRADESSNWGDKKQFVPSGPRGGGGFGGGDRYEDRAERGGSDGPSRADEVDNWGASKKFVPSLAGGRAGGGGGGFDRDRGDRDRRGGNDDLRPSRADEVDNWGAKKKFVASAPPRSSGGFGSGGGSMPPGRAGMDADRWSRVAPAPDRGADAPVARSGERPRLVLSKRSTDIPAGAPGADVTPAPANGSSEGAPASEAGETAPVKPKPSPFGAAKPRDEPVIAAKADTVVAPGSRSGSGEGAQATAVTSAPRPKVNPFGDAKPREVRLQEQGKDWRMIDAELEHKGVDRPESEEELRLKEKIAELEDRIKRGSKPAGGEEAAKDDSPAPLPSDTDTSAVADSSSSTDTLASSVVANGDSAGETATSASPPGAAAPRQLTYAEKMAQAIFKEELAKGLTEERKAQLAAEKEDLQNQLVKLTRDLDDKVRFVRGAGAGPGVRGRDGRADIGPGGGPRGGDRYSEERGGR